MNIVALFNTGAKKDSSSYTQNLVNDTDKTKIFVTAVYPTKLDSPFESRIADLEVTTKEQLPNLVALAAVQHSIISAKKPWQLSNNGGFFITQGGGCLSPFCVIVEQGMIVVDPDGACTPDKLNKRKAKYPTINPSKLFDPFPASQNTITVPVSSIVDPKHPNVSARVNRDNGYLIFQPVPPGATLKQQLNFSITNEND
jgi:hypothetical protein